MAARKKSASTKSATKVSGADGKLSRSDAALVANLSDTMCASILPGEEPFSREQMDEAAAFLFTASETREAGEPVVEMTSATADKRFMRIAVVNEDMPFLVDSVASLITAEGVTIDRLVHPVVPVRRNAGGRIEALGGSLSPSDKAVVAESMIYIETDRVDAKQRRALERALRTVLGDVRAAVSDWSKMRAAMEADIERVVDEEGAALLDWLNKGMLTQLGHITRHRDGSHSKVLGICRRSAKSILADESYDRAFAWFESRDEGSERAPLVVKANRLSNVHRRVPLDLFIVPVRENGDLVALSIHAGVWTSAGLSAPPASVPRLRAQLVLMMDELQFSPTGHAGKALIHALTTLPHDLLVGFEDEDIIRVTTTMMSLVDRPRPRLALVEAPLARHLFAFAWLPRDSLSTAVRLQIQSLLQRGANADILDWSVQVEGGNLAMMRFVLDLRGGDYTIDEAALDKRLQDMLRGWSEAVEGELAHDMEPGRAAAIAQRFAGIFPATYRGTYGAAEAARDIGRLRRLSALDLKSSHAAPLRDARLYRFASDAPGRLRLKVIQHRGALALTDAVPALENFGFTVLTERPTPLNDGELGTINDFLLSLPTSPETPDAAATTDAMLQRGDAIEEAIAAVLNEHAEDDPFNRLVITTGLSAQQAGWLRATYRYLRQTGMGFTIYTVVDALDRAPDVTRALIALFDAVHDPDFSGKREPVAKAAREAIRAGLANVHAINDDRLLRLYQAVFEAVLRTNAFAPAADEALAFKIDSSLIPNLPKPVPWREIFVYSRRVEGIHLRAGAVARGGLRWSDRRDDFRTEVLGLMKAQRVKNAVIVPTGAKGGFYPKQLPSPAIDREGWAAEGQASYKVFIRTLLSVTDNIVDGKVVHPDRVVITDGNDPYFVVAADKGTARFSDVANAIAESRDFWLDDAFASGGSNGYDHKAMGITARGAWVSVQRHFREMGVDVQSDEITVAGCGDMSGDVFGNGMLLSKTIRLVAAFDHRHIFIDPDPDAAKSWTERKRLFGLARSSWEDYDSKLISKGGGVFPRSAKRIELSDQTRALLGIEADEIEPDALISAILKAEVDLLWFGGIGTYIKNSTENNAVVGDPANDTIRIDGEEVGAKVIGEGANLGVTQAGRIEFALAGGRINTDFIDNSAGVDCSDNEVNIKIALAAARRDGKLSEKKRNALLVQMTDEVAQIVLEDNRLQALALSIAEIGGAKATAAQMRLIETLEEMGDLDRRTEGLADGEQLSRRAADGTGLTRPELAVLLSSAKLSLQDAIENSALPDDPAMEPVLLGYFPEPMRKTYRAQILGHRLRREIIATEIANRVVNRLGLVHPFELQEEEGVTLAQVATAFVTAEELFDFPDLWERLEQSDMNEDARLLLFDRVAVAMRGQMADLLRIGVDRLGPAETVAQLQKGVSELSRETGSLLAAESRQQAETLCRTFTQAGAPKDLATDAVHLFEMDGSIGLARLAVDTGIAPRKLTGAFTELGGALGLDWAQGTATLMNPSDIWERMLVAGLARDFQQMRLDFLARLARRKDGKADPRKAVTAWLDANSDAIRQFRSMIGRAQRHPQVAPAMLAQIASQARNLLLR
ncbi:Glutamate dehydrogenase [Alteripontixanthobacter maritimus]|uniref:Glutamate dehydrogenase n=1 Tax=Alteripontixanthobacter maritimus TaxID=2161824 RepID=A0A369QDD5_9SPHN|nr:NAD-glutamate dehydrogenase domain-containing protein [Alteripontixanthobacter maritimus]RDC61257.1 Glutamate dehydrogenase [Alteripontixanthobacter maritimus]